MMNKVVYFKDSGHAIQRPNILEHIFFTARKFFPTFRRGWTRKPPSH